MIISYEKLVFKNFAFGFFDHGFLFQDFASASASAPKMSDFFISTSEKLYNRETSESQPWTNFDQKFLEKFKQYFSKL